MPLSTGWSFFLFLLNLLLVVQFYKYDMFSQHSQIMDI